MQVGEYIRPFIHARMLHHVHQAWGVGMARLQSSLAIVHSNESHQVSWSRVDAISGKCPAYMSHVSGECQTHVHALEGGLEHVAWQMTEQYMKHNAHVLHAVHCCNTARIRHSWMFGTLQAQPCDPRPGYEYRTSSCLQQNQHDLYGVYPLASGPGVVPRHA